MIKILLRRPIAVFMAFTACFIIGIVTYKTLPVSLLPDIAIPEITIQVSGENTSARELENTVMRTLRAQLMQVGRLEDLYSETRDGSGIVRMRFEHGTNTDLAFIEVNEKIDVAMSYLPKSTMRPRVIKASATDIPVLYLNITLKDEKTNAPDADELFLELCDFANNVVRRRIEQLQEVAMVDISGLTHKQVQIIPQHSKMEALGITVRDIENALANSNVEPGSMTVREGYYEYNIRFSTVVRTVEDIENIPLRHDGRIMRLGELAHVRLVPATEIGLTQYNGKRSVSLAIIKQADENMDRMKSALNGMVHSLQYAHPDINFDISRNQTELLDYTLNNLQQNLTLGFLFILIVAMLFMGGVRSPIVIGICMVVAIIISFIFFYFFDMSLNIISLSGLILAEGMMIDNAIIVTENITQYRDTGHSIDEACILGTNEVVTPMLSSSLTTIAVFIPLVFISGIAGAIFYDEAFAVTVGLIASYITGITLLPVLYKIVFSVSQPKFFKRRILLCTPATKVIKKNNINLNTTLSCFYDKGFEWVFSHKKTTIIVTLFSIPLCILMFNIMPKERMPETSRTELSVHIEWNENIHLDDNRHRMEELEKFCATYSEESSTHIGIQQYLLEKSLVSTTEAELYLRTATPQQLKLLQQVLQKELSTRYPQANVSYHEPKNVFERIFDTNEPELVVELYNRNKEKQNDIALLRNIEKNINLIAGENATAPSTGQQINLIINRERLLMYGVTYDEISRLLCTALRDNKIATLRSFQTYLPITISGGEHTLDGILNHTFVTIPALDDRKVRHQVPLRDFVTQTKDEGIKTITAGMAGEYVPYTFADTEHAKRISDDIKESLRNNADDWEVSFSGAYFSSNKMINELVIVLFISLLLMYFILTSQFGSFVQPLIVLAEIPIDVGFALIIMEMLGISLNLMSAIGIVVSCGIIINDSILKLDMINVIRSEGIPLLEAIHTAGNRRLRSIVMTSLTTMLAMVPLLFTHDFGSELQRPLAVAMISTMLVGTLVSLFVIPLIYWFIYRNKTVHTN